MKALLLCTLALCCSLKAAQCCSCVQDSISRSRPTAITDDFFFRYSSSSLSSCMDLVGSLHIAMLPTPTL